MAMQVLPGVLVVQTHTYSAKAETEAATDTGTPRLPDTNLPQLGRVR